MIIGGKTIKGKHTFELFDNVSFEGRTPSTIPTNTCLTITHAIASPQDWHFPPKANLTIIADGVGFNVPKPNQIQLTKDDPRDAEFYEVLITKPTYEMYKKIANASLVKIRIGTASFTLDSESIASYRDFVGYLTPGNKEEPEPKAEWDRRKWRNWTSADGQFTRKAKYVKVIGDSVYLEKEDGSTIQVNKDKLDSADLTWISSKGWEKDE